MRVDNYLMKEKLSANDAYRRINQVIIDRETETTYVYRAGMRRPEIFRFKETPEQVLLWAMCHDMVSQGKYKTVFRAWKEENTRC